LVGISISISPKIYEKILNTSDVIKDIVGDWVRENLGLIYELSSISTDIANEINRITKWVDSWKIETKEFIEEPDDFYRIKQLIQKKSYERLIQEGKLDLDIRQVYIYDNWVPLYQKLLSLYEEYNNSKIITFYEFLEYKIDILVEEFVEYYKNNEQFFIDRFKFNNNLWDIVGYHLDEGIRRELALKR
jgi:hypothetical protein